MWNLLVLREKPRGIQAQILRVSCVINKETTLTNNRAIDLCVSAAMASVKDAIGNFDWPSRGTAVVNTKTPEDGVDTPEKQTDTSTDPTPRTITMAHFDHAFTEVVPSFSEEASSQLSRWHEKFSHSPGTARNSYPTSRKPRPWMNGKVNGYQFS